MNPYNNNYSNNQNNPKNNPFNNIKTIDYPNANKGNYNNKPPNMGNYSNKPPNMGNYSNKPPNMGNQPNYGNYNNPNMPPNMGNQPNYGNYNNPNIPLNMPPNMENQPYGNYNNPNIPPNMPPNIQPNMQPNMGNQPNYGNYNNPNIPPNYGNYQNIPNNQPYGNQQNLPPNNPFNLNNFLNNVSKLSSNFYTDFSYRNMNFGNYTPKQYNISKEFLKERLKQKFVFYDTYNQRKLPMDVVFKIINEIYLEANLTSPNPYDIAYYMNQFDINKDGFLDERELIRMLKSLSGYKTYNYYENQNYYN